MKNSFALKSVIYTAIKKTHRVLVLGSTNDADNVKKTGGYVNEAAKRYASQVINVFFPVAKSHRYDAYRIASVVATTTAEDLQDLYGKRQVRKAAKWVKEEVGFPSLTGYLFPHPLYHDKGNDYELVVLSQSGDYENLILEKKKIYLDLDSNGKNLIYHVITPEGKGITDEIEISEILNAEGSLCENLKDRVLDITSNRQHTYNRYPLKTMHDKLVAIGHLGRVGNCDIHANLVAHYLWQWQAEHKDYVLIRHIEIISFSALDHCVVLVNRNLECSLNAPDEWGDECIVIDAWKASSTRYDLEPMSMDKELKENTIYIELTNDDYFIYYVITSEGNIAKGKIELSEVLSPTPQIPITVDLLKPAIKKIEEITSRNGHTESYFYPNSLFNVMMRKLMPNPSLHYGLIRADMLINPISDSWQDNWRWYDLLPPADIQILGDDGMAILRDQIEAGLREHKGHTAGFF